MPHQKESIAREQVKGGQDDGAPGIQAQYSKDDFAAYCRDQKGNKQCFVNADGLAAPSSDATASVQHNEKAP